MAARKLVLVGPKPSDEIRSLLPDADWVHEEQAQQDDQDHRFVAEFNDDAKDNIEGAEDKEYILKNYHQLIAKLSEYDWAFIPAHRRFNLFLADMDSTMSQIETLDCYAKSVDRLEEIERRVSLLPPGEVMLMESLGLRLDVLKGAKAPRRFNPPGNIGGASLIKALNKLNIRSVLVSSGFTFSAEPLGESLGFSKVISHEMKIKDGLVSGEWPEPLIDGEAKAAALISESKDLSVPQSQTIAIGDGSNDIPMLKAAGLGIAYYAKPKVQAIATASIQHGTLTRVLDFIGINRNEWPHAIDNDKVVLL